MTVVDLLVVTWVVGVCVAYLIGWRRGCTEWRHRYSHLAREHAELKAALWPRADPPQNSLTNPGSER